MRVLNGVPNYEVTEANFECIRIALNYIGEKFTPEYFHGIAGTAFRIGGICPCAPTCTLAMLPGDLIKTLGYDCEIIPYDDTDKDGSLTRLTEAVRESIDGGIPAIVWNAFTQCEYDVVTGYDENDKVFYGRGSHVGNKGDCAKRPWDRSLEQAGLAGLTALIIRRGTGVFDKKTAETAALKEAVRHANDKENVDKLGEPGWVFLQGKAAYKRWADDFSKPDYKRGAGDAYCAGIYSDCHALAGPFLRVIASAYPHISTELNKAAKYFDGEAENLKTVNPLITWDSPETSAERSEKAAPLLREAARCYGAGIDILSEAIVNL